MDFQALVLVSVVIGMLHGMILTRRFPGIFRMLWTVPLALLSVYAGGWLAHFVSFFLHRKPPLLEAVICIAVVMSLQIVYRLLANRWWEKHDFAAAVYNR